MTYQLGLSCYIAQYAGGAPDEGLVVEKSDIDGWMFSDEQAIEWTNVADGLSMKTLGSAGGRLLALFRLEPGYEGGIHTHTDAEFTYVLEGAVECKGVPLAAGGAYSAEPGTSHDPPLRTDGGALLLSVYGPHAYPENEDA